MITFAVTIAAMFSWMWGAWILMFLAIEFGALYLRRIVPDPNRSGGTLSELVWRIIRGYTWQHRVAMILFVIFWSWLTIHFLFL